MATKTWKVTLILEVKEGSHPRKWIPDAIQECLDYDNDEDCLEYHYEVMDDSYNILKSRNEA